MDYNWIKALHIIAVVAWMAGLLMLPRLMAYQLEAEPNGELFRKMDEAIARLKKIILTPSLVLVWILGLYLIWSRWQVGSEGLSILAGDGWLHAKLLLVFILSGLHGYFTAQARKISAGSSKISAKTLRLMNEVPFIIAILVIILAVVEPF